MCSVLKDLITTITYINKYIENRYTDTLFKKINFGSNQFLIEHEMHIAKLGKR